MNGGGKGGASGGKKLSQTPPPYKKMRNRWQEVILLSREGEGAKERKERAPYFVILPNKGGEGRKL